MRRILKALGDRVRGLLKGQRGFTLVEVLVAVGIVAILAGIAVPMVTRFISTAEDRAQEAEFSNVQTAVDALMADELVGALTNLNPSCAPAAVATANMAAFPCTGAGEIVLHPDYVRVDNGEPLPEGPGYTECSYTVEDGGTVSVGTCP